MILNLTIAAAAVCFAAMIVTLLLAVFLGARKDRELDHQWQADAQRRQQMLASRWTADVQALDKRPTMGDQERYLFMEKARIGQ